MKTGSSLINLEHRLFQSGDLSNGHSRNQRKGGRKRNSPQCSTMTRFYDCLSQSFSFRPASIAFLSSPRFLRRGGKEGYTCRPMVPSLLLVIVHKTITSEPEGLGQARATGYINNAVVTHSRNIALI